MHQAQAQTGGQKFESQGEILTVFVFKSVNILQSIAKILKSNPCTNRFQLFEK